MITYEQICNSLKEEVKSLSNSELETKIKVWSKKADLKIYVSIFDKELKTRNVRK